LALRDLNALVVVWVAGVDDDFELLGHVASLGTGERGRRWAGREEPL
jgi:hypothetical protein